MKQDKTKILLMMAIAIIVWLCPNWAQAQFIEYQVLECEQVSPSVIKLSIIVYGNDKKSIDTDAMIAALNVAMFDGIEGTSFSKPLLEDGVNTSISNNPNYFNPFYDYRYQDFIQSCTMVSKFKKADKKKGTSYTIEIKILNLRKDLEKNQIRKKLGI